MARPTAASQDNASSTSNVSTYTGTAGKSWTAGRLYVLFFYVTKSSGGAIADPTINFVTNTGVTWTKKQTDVVNTRDKLGFYWLIPSSSITDQVQINFGADSGTGIDFIVVEFQGMYKGNGGGSAFNVSAIATGTSTTPSASLASAPNSNSLTMGFAGQQANAGFTVGTGFTTKIETAGHNTPTTRAAAEVDSGTAQQTAAWTITSATWYAYALEMMIAVATVNQVTQTDTPNATAPQKTRAVGQVTETDTPNAMGRLKTLVVAQVGETDTAQAMGRLKTLGVGQVTETDEAEPITAAHSATVGQVTETDEAEAIDGDKIGHVAQVVETDDAEPMGLLKTLGVAQVVETDEAEPIASAHGHTIGQVTETDEAEAIGRLKKRLTGNASEVDSAAVMRAGKILIVAQVVETDEAEPIGRLKKRLTGNADEIDTASVIFAGKKLFLGAVLETDTALAITGIGGGEPPDVLGDAILAAVSRPRKGLGLVRHSLMSPTGEALVLHLGSWESLETAHGGYISASGLADAALMDRFPAALADGAVLRSYLVATEELVWAGRLLDLARERGKAMLVAEGFGLDADQSFERLLWQNADASTWIEMASDPAAVPADEDKFTVDINDGRIKLSMVEGTELVGDEQHGAAFVASPELITRLQFTLKVYNVVTDRKDKYVVRLFGGSGPPYDASDWAQIGSDIDLSTYTGPEDIDLEIDTAPSMIALILARKTGETAASAGAFWVRFVDPKVNGRALDTEYGASSIARDLFGILGLSGFGVQELGGDLLPLDRESVTAAQVFDELALQMDAAWGIRDTGAGSYGAFEEWGLRTFYAPTSRGVRPQPEVRYDSVAVPHRTANPKVNGMSVTAAPYKLKKSRQYLVPIEGELPPEDRAASLGAILAPYLVTQRFSGEASLSEVIDHAGQVWSAHRLKPGSHLVVPGYAEPFRIVEVRRTDRGVDVVFDDSNARITAIVNQALRLARVS